VTRSGQRAQGIAQFMPTTAAERRLDDPFDPVQALPKSAEFLHDLWNQFEDGSFLQRIQAFGMNTATFTSSVPNWGFMYCSAEDLDNLMNYVLDKAPANVRNYLVFRLQHVSSIDQQWGVWGAGPENHPGNKDGWELDPPWITNGIAVWASIAARRSTSSNAPLLCWRCTLPIETAIASTAVSRAKRPASSGSVPAEASPPAYPTKPISPSQDTPARWASSAIAAVSSMFCRSGLREPSNMTEVKPASIP